MKEKGNLLSIFIVKTQQSYYKLGWVKCVIMGAKSANVQQPSSEAVRMK